MRKYQEAYGSTPKIIVMITSKTLSQLNLNQGLKITDCEIKLMLTWSKNWVI